jgi:uncharacterized protein YycO
MFKKVILLLLILTLTMSAIASASSTEDINDLTKEQKKIIERNQKDLIKDLKKQGVDLKSETAKDVLESAFNNDVFNFRLLNEEVSEEEFIALEESGTNSPGAVWFTPSDVKGGSYTGHTGIVDNNTSYTTEAFPGIGVAQFKNDWKTRDKYSKVYLLGVSGASVNQYKSAATYAKVQIGKGYNYEFAARWNLYRYYCSSLAWRSWEQQGFNFDGKTSGTIYPSDIYNSSLTYVITKKES